MNNQSYRQEQRRTRGAAMLIFIIFFVFASSAFTFAIARSAYSDAAALASLARSKQAFLASEALAEDVAYRNIYDGSFSVGLLEALDWYGATAQATTTVDTANEEYVVEARGERGQAVRKTRVTLTLGAGNSFNYGLQSGTGGISLANSASVIGNVYSNGAIEGQGSSLIEGDVVSAGPTGLIDGIHATGSAWAHTLSDSLIEGDAYYTVVGVPSVVNGIRYTPSPDQPIATLPIDDATIEEWKQAVVDYGTVIAATDPECSTGTYTIDSDTTIGYLKVECNLDIVKTGASVTVTVTGPIWVEGNLSFTQGPIIQVDPSLGRRSVQFIADNESDRLTSSRIEIRNSTTFNGSGDDRSLVMLLSRNESASQGGAGVAIEVAQSANGDVMVYAADGLVNIGNGISLKEVTAYQINIAQNSDVVYESGLASLLFTSGPGGGYVLADWTETD